jgi:hypothetical protein
VKIGFPPQADQVSLLRPSGYGGQAGFRCQEEPVLNNETLYETSWNDE